MHARGERAGVAQHRARRRWRASCASTCSAGLPRRRRRLRAHRHRRVRELPQVREAARAQPGADARHDARPATPRARHRRGRIHRHAHRARAARRRARASSASTTSSRTTTSRSRRRGSRTLAGAPGFAFERARSRGRRGDRRAVRATALHARRASRGAAGRALFADRIPAPTCATTSTAFGHVLEGCRHARLGAPRLRVVSSVYGANHALPFSEDQRVDQPVSLYAATKAPNELMAHSYSHLFGLPATGLRFFTVYGPWGRPDRRRCCSPSAILAGEPINVFNDGDMQRDFTYVDDIVEGVVRVLAHRRRAPRRRRRRAARDLQHRQPPGGRARDVHRDARARCSAARRSATTGRCSPATCRRPTRRSSGCRRSRASRRARRSRTGSRASSPGTATTTACSAARARRHERGARIRRSSRRLSARAFPT